MKRHFVIYSFPLQRFSLCPSVSQDKRPVAPTRSLRLVAAPNWANRGGAATLDAVVASLRSLLPNDLSSELVAVHRQSGLQRDTDDAHQPADDKPQTDDSPTGTSAAAPRPICVEFNSLAAASAAVAAINSAKTSGATAGRGEGDEKRVKRTKAFQAELVAATEGAAGTRRGGRIIIRNLPLDVKLNDVKEFVQKFGTIEEMRIPMKPAVEGASETQARGFAFVQYGDYESAAAAVKGLNLRRFGQRIVTAAHAVDQRVYQAMGKAKAQQDSEQKQGSSVGDVEHKNVDAHENAKMKKSNKPGDNKDGEKEGKENPRTSKADAAQSKSGDADKADEKEKTENAKTSKGEKEASASPSTPPTKADELSRTVFCRNLAFDVDGETLREAFTQRFGPAQSAIICINRTTGVSKGTGFVCFKEKSSADSAIAASKFAEAEAAANSRKRDADQTDDDKDKNSKGKAAAAVDPSMLGGSRKKAEKHKLLMQKILTDLPFEGQANTKAVILHGRRITVLPAIDRSEAHTLDEATSAKRATSGTSNLRKLLESCWELPTDIEDALSANDKKRRKQTRLEALRRLNGGGVAINPLRLCIRNLPKHVNSSTLHTALSARLDHLDEFRKNCDDDFAIPPATTKKTLQLRRPARAFRHLAVMGVRKIRFIRDPQQDDDKSGLPTEAKAKLKKAKGALREGVTSAALTAVRNEQDQKTARGFAFVDVKTELLALKIRDAFNGSDIFGDPRRPIVDFAIDDAQKAHVQQRKTEAHQQRVSAAKQQRKSEEGSKLKKTDEGNEPKLSRGARQREKRRASRQSAAAKQTAAPPTASPGTGTQSTTPNFIKTSKQLVKLDKQGRAEQRKKRQADLEATRLSDKREAKRVRRLKIAQEPDKDDLELRALKRRSRQRLLDR
eukprot:Selendium_serpulae@DN6389_c2_g3_i2.p1